MAQRSREELLALFPDIAAGLDKVERRGFIAPTRSQGTRKPGLPRTVKTVKGRAGYGTYTTVNWDVVGTKRYERRNGRNLVTTVGKGTALPKKDNLIHSSGK